jgi:hypothetical protein
MGFYSLPNELLVVVSEFLDVKSYAALLLVAKLFSVIRFDLYENKIDVISGNFSACVINTAETFDLPNRIRSFGDLVAYVALSSDRPVPRRHVTHLVPHLNLAQVSWIKRQLRCARRVAETNHFYLLAGELFVGSGTETSCQFQPHGFAVTSKNQIKITAKGKEDLARELFPVSHPQRQQGESDLLEKFTKGKFNQCDGFDQHRPIQIHVCFCRHFHDVDHTRAWQE